MDCITRLIRFIFNVFVVCLGFFLFFGVVGLISPDVGAALLLLFFVLFIVYVFRR